MQEHANLSLHSWKHPCVKYVSGKRVNQLYLNFIHSVTCALEMCHRRHYHPLWAVQLVVMIVTRRLIRIILNILLILEVRQLLLNLVQNLYCSVLQHQDINQDSLSLYRRFKAYQCCYATILHLHFCHFSLFNIM